MERIKIPTALSQRETELLQKLALSKNVLEIGSLLGYSTVNIAKKALEVTSIDPHEGYPFEGADSTLPLFIDNLLKYRVENVKIIKDFFHKVSIGMFDFAFIDLNGKYETTKKVIEATKHIPIVAIHDYGRQNCSGVAEAVKDSKSNIIQVVDTTIILENK